MVSLTKKPITKAQAQARTDEHKRELKVLQKGWVHLGKEVKKSVEMGVPAALGMNMRAWIEDTFPGSSASHVFRQLANFEALRHVPVKDLEKMPEGNANQFATRLPEKFRKNKEIIQKAITLKPAEFKEVVNEAREKVGLGTKGDKWETFAVRLPQAVYDLLKAAEAKMARVLQLDIDDQQKRTASLITIWEAIAVLVNDTDESLLAVELIGGLGDANAADPVVQDGETAPVVPHHLESTQEATA